VRWIEAKITAIVATVNHVRVQWVGYYIPLSEPAVSSQSLSVMAAPLVLLRMRTVELSCCAPRMRYGKALSVDTR
jgi:hypothetical protein